MKLPLLVSIFALAFTSRVASSAPAPVERDPKAAWSMFEQALEFHHLVDAQLCIGSKVLFEGKVLDGFTDKVHWLRPNPLRVSICRFVAAEHKWIDTGIVCRVTLRESEIKPVAGFGAASIGIHVLGTIKSFDPVSRTVEIQSDATEVNWSD